MISFVMSSRNAIPVTTPPNGRRPSLREIADNDAALVMEGLRRLNHGKSKPVKTTASHGQSPTLTDEQIERQFEGSARQRAAMGQIVHHPRRN